MTYDGDLDFLEEDFCIRVLCEHEQGWHTTDETFPVFGLNSRDKQVLLQLVAPYLGRIFALLSHSGVSVRLTYTYRQRRRFCEHTFNHFDVACKPILNGTKNGDVIWINFIASKINVGSHISSALAFSVIFSNQFLKMQT